MKPVRFFCGAGVLLGDSIMLWRGLVKLSQQYHIKIVSGSYARDSWDFAIEHLEGLDAEVVGSIQDPDALLPDGSAVHPLAPGLGFLAIERAKDIARQRFPGEKFLTLSWESMREGEEFLDSDHSYIAHRTIPTTKLTMKSGVLAENGRTAVHPYSHHEWKNLENLLHQVNYTRPVDLISGPADPVLGRLKPIGERSFRANALRTLQSSVFVGIQSAYACLAAVFGKTQLTTSFSDDGSLDYSVSINSRAVHLVRPTHEVLQQHLLRIGA